MENRENRSNSSQLLRYLKVGVFCPVKKSGESTWTTAGSPFVHKSETWETLLLLEDQKFDQDPEVQSKAIYSIVLFGEQIYAIVQTYLMSDDRLVENKNKV